MLYNNLNQIHIWNFRHKIQVFNCPIYHYLINFVTSKCTFMLKHRSSKRFIIK